MRGDCVYGVCVKLTSFRRSFEVQRALVGEFYILKISCRSDNGRFFGKSV